MVRPIPTDSNRSGADHSTSFGVTIAGVGPQRLLDHRPHRAGCRDDVVVAEQQIARALDRLEHLVGRGGESAAPAHPSHEGTGCDLGDPRRRVVGAPGVDHQDRELRVLLVGQRPEARLEPPSGVARDHHRGHRRSLRWCGGCCVHRATEASGRDARGTGDALALATVYGSCYSS